MHSFSAPQQAQPNAGNAAPDQNEDRSREILPVSEAPKSDFFTAKRRQNGEFDLALSLSGKNA